MNTTRDRVMQLLAERATEGLDATRAAELDHLLGEHPEWDDDTFDLAAAAIDQALSAPPDPLPAQLRDRLRATAAGFAAQPSSSHPPEQREPRPPARTGSSGARQGMESVQPPAEIEPADLGQRRSDVVHLTRPGAASWAGWLAAAAALILAAVAWWPNVDRIEPVEPLVAETTAPGAAEQRALLLAEADDVVRIDWSATEDTAAAGAAGDVVWSASRQTGYMRIAGLQANDPAAAQYQLWVFDEARDERFPVDGGVFDVPADGEVIVPIDTKLPVDRATLFAVTVEPPGGVVVSSRERIVLVAPVG